MRALGIALVCVVCVVCVAGACRTYDTIYTSDAGGQCLPPSGICSGLCVDTSSDRLNCGGCNQVCAQNAVCSNGACTACSGSAEVVCGTSGAAFCTNLATDDKNCGACGAACPHGTTCANAQCSCPLTTCGSDCVDTSSDVNHCGGCNSPCPSAGPNEIAVCIAGHCSAQCVAPFADCDGAGGNGCEANLQTGTATCGACGRTCTSGTCSGGACPITTYTAGQQLAALAIDATSVYWADQSLVGGIESAPLAGGSTQPVFADNLTTVLAVDSGRIAWMHLNTQLESRAISGGAVTLLTAQSGLQAMTTFGGYVYFSTVSSVQRVPVDGSSIPVTIFQTSDAISLATDGANVYAVTSGGDILFAPVGAQNVSPSLLVSIGAQLITLDATNVYWVTNAGTLASHAKSGTAQAKLLVGENVTTNLATDGTSLYWGNFDGSVRRIPVTGGVPLKVATSQGSLEAVAVDGTRVYWTAQSGVASTTK